MNVRKKAGDNLKAHYNLLWDQCTQQGRGDLSYRDAVRIADAIRYEGPSVLGLTNLPEEIDAGLQLSVAVVDPNEARAKESLKAAFSGLTGTAGLAVLAGSIGVLVNPGVWAVVVAFFVGGTVGGPLVIATAAAGLFLVMTAVYTAFSKMTPRERTAKSHECVMTAIDAWVGDGKETLLHGRPTSIPQDFTLMDLSFATTLLLEIATVDGYYSPQERAVLRERVGLATRAGGGVDKAISHLSTRSQSLRHVVVGWCHDMAAADGHVLPEARVLLADFERRLNAINENPA